MHFFTGLAIGPFTSAFVLRGGEEVTEVKAPANRFELAYGAELADDQDALFRPEEPADGAVALLV
ncbi:MAG TPA: hypothetical protein VIL71_00545 [Spirillospora sp.]